MERRPFFIPRSPHKTRTSRRLCIADVLLTLDDEEEIRMERCVSGGGGDQGHFRAECLSPIRIISRLFRRMTAKKPAGKSNDGYEARDQEASPPVVASHAVVPGINNKENAVNLGVACSLLGLTAACKNEVEKMKELQGEMRAFLREIKVELKGKELTREPAEVVVGSPNSCLTVAEATHNCSCQRTPFVVAEEKSSAGDWPNGSGKSRKDCMQEMEELEAELEAELERLQLHLDSDTPSKKGRQQHATKVQTEDSVPATSGSTTTGEVMNPHDVGGPELRGGVPPFELKRKLHELLQSRQQERIKELETALECYEHELREKGKEISWWRDTALLLLQRAKESPSKGAYDENNAVYKEILPH